MQIAKAKALGRTESVNGTASRVDGGMPARCECGRDGWRKVCAKFSNRDSWLDWVVVLIYAAATGLLVVALNQLSEAAATGFRHLRGFGRVAEWFALVWTPALTVAILLWAHRFAPGTFGSGVPHVLVALDDETPGEQRQRFVSLRLALHKIGLVAAGHLAGLSIGREGPAVQIGAGVMQHSRRWLSSRCAFDSSDLMVAGAAAGIAATFNTPLGGLIFALEQLSRRRGSLSHNAVVIFCVLVAGAVGVAIFGDRSYYGEIRIQRLSWSLLGPGMLTVLVAGLAGGLFSRLIVVSARGLPDRFSRWRSDHPLRFAAACAASVALIGLVTDGETFGGGYSQTRALLEGQYDVSPAYTVLRFCATWLSSWTGVPAGVFAPSLAIGAGIGHDIAAIMNLQGEAAIPLIALGMVGFLAAATQGPITAFVIVMEMVSGHRMLLSLMAAALLASGVARLLTGPMYLELARLLAANARATPSRATLRELPKKDMEIRAGRPLNSRCSETSSFWTSR